MRGFGPSRSSVAGVQLAEIQRWSVKDRRPIGRPLPILAGGVRVSPDAKTLVTVKGRSIQKWDMATMSKVGEPFSVEGTLQRIEFACDGEVLVTHSRVPGARTGRPGLAYRMKRFRIGVNLQPVDGGLLITEVMAGDPAANAGLKVNDVILQIDERAGSHDQGLWAAG